MAHDIGTFKKGELVDGLTIDTESMTFGITQTAGGGGDKPAKKSVSGRIVGLIVQVDGEGGEGGAEEGEEEGAEEGEEEGETGQDSPAAAGSGSKRGGRAGRKRGGVDLSGDDPDEK